MKTGSSFVTPDYIKDRDIMIDILLVTESESLFPAVIEGLEKYPGMFVTCASTSTEATNIIRSHTPSVAILCAHLREPIGEKPLFELLIEKKVPVIAISHSSRMRNELLMRGAVSFHHQVPDFTDEQLSAFIRLLAEDITRIFTEYDLTTSRARAPYSRSGVEIITLGASTGGTSAIEGIVTSLPGELPPILITQHMPKGFTQMFADRLNKLSKLNIHEAADYMRLEKGDCVIAKGGEYMELFRDDEGYFIRSRPGEKNGVLCPTVDVMFESTAKAAGKNTLAFLLTGMGADGAQGMLALKRAGAYTVVQDKESSVIYGMPKEAKELGAACMEISLSHIPDFIKRKLGFGGYYFT